MKTSSALNELLEAMEFHRDPEKAVGMKKYMKNHFEFLGISQPVRKELSRPFLRQMKNLTMEEVLVTANALWTREEREYQYVSMELLYDSRKQWNANAYEFFLNLVTRKSWWDTVDYIASRLVGGYLLNQKNLAPMKSWVKSANLWQNRTAILFQLNYKEDTDIDFLFSTILALKDKKDFFIQKAIGWSLRQYFRTDPEVVVQFVESSGLTGLARREALKHAG